MYLSRVRIHNLALVEEIDVEFLPGVIAVTGETGAGKSMILGSLELLLGQRAESSLVRVGAKKAVIEGVFTWREPTHPQADAQRALLAEQGYELEADDPLIIRREISADGRSVGHIAGRLVTMRELTDITSLFVTIHAQHAQQSLGRRAWQRDTLDAFADAEKDAEVMRDAWRAWKDAQQGYEEWIAHEREHRQRADMLAFHSEEIHAAALQPGEEKELLAVESTLAHAEELREHATALHDLLSDDTTGVVAQLHQARRICARMREKDPSCAAWDESLATACAHVDDLATECASYLTRVESDPSALAKVQDRLHTITQLRKKYGDTIEEILAYCAKIDEERAQYEDCAAMRASWEKKVADAYAHAEKCATILSQKRQKAALTLGKRVEQELAVLGMPDARFVVDITPVETLTAHGKEDIEFLISSNPGEEPKSLRKVASGGEISRIMLALKCIATEGDDVVVLVFDEIDAGISATVAHAVGERLQALEQRHQVFVITHMPQIACRARGHYTVAKRVQNERTYVTITPLSGAAREEEIARMLGGDTEAARRHATELCRAAEKVRKDIHHTTYSRNKKKKEKAL